MFGPFDDQNLSGQPDLLSLSRERLVEAFSVIRNAGLQGVSQAEILQLTRDLNRALDLQHQANITGSTSNATMSIAFSTQLSSKATALQNEAQLQRVQLEILVYSTAFWVALLSALVVMEAHRIDGWLRERRTLRMRLISGGRSNAA